MVPLAGSPGYTMEELMRRIRRIEKLTERMSQGKFEGKDIQIDPRK
jgi:hypothetical protein